MILDEAPPLGVNEASRLVAALSSINAARVRRAGDPRRTHALLEGLERLLDALPGADAGRDSGAADSLAELETILAEGTAGEVASDLHGYLEPILERLIDALLGFPGRRLAAYGSLLPGEDNHHYVRDLVGRWVEGTVEGTLHDRGWAARRGYPGLAHHIPGDQVRVGVLFSGALPAAWERLDTFEGPAYRRILAPVETTEGLWICNVYELADAP